MTRGERTAALLAEFDRRRRWVGIGFYAHKYKVSTQYTAWLLAHRRPERYGKLRHPNRGKRNDLMRSDT